MKFCLPLLLLSICAQVFGSVEFIFPLAYPNAYQGYVWKNSQYVQIVPEIRAKASSGKICGYRIHHEAIKDLPFILELIDQDYGFVEIRVKPGTKINYKNQDKYTFQIEAYSCDSIPEYSERVFVTIDVRNDLCPAWSKDTYNFMMNEGQPAGTRIGRVAAYDSSNNGICRYEISMPANTPFDIDREGIITTKKVLLSSYSTRYEFRVKAENCDIHEPKSTTVKVSVDVMAICYAGWQGFPDLVEYRLEHGFQRLTLGSLRLESCGQPCKSGHEITTRLTLTRGMNAEDNIIQDARSAFCAQDRKSLTIQKSVCGASRDAIDLLPSSKEFVSQAKGSGRTDKQSGVLEFDGLTTFTTVPASKFPDDHYLGSSFTISFWLKHGPMSSIAKEQILCNSDGDGMNRHHYSVFLHNCKLVLLLRREYDPVNRLTASPAEWRFGPLRELCEPASNQHWHRYSLVNMEGEVNLLLDGKAVNEKDIIDDLPLHEATSRVHYTSLSIGACRHGRTGLSAQHLKGYLADLTILRNQVESPTVLQCMSRCGESLLLPHVAQVMESGTSVSLVYNSIQVTGSKPEQLAKMLNKVVYVNLRDKNRQRNLLIKTRQVKIDTFIKCGKLNRKLRQSSITLKLTSTNKKADTDKESSLIITANNEVTGSMSNIAELPILPNLHFKLKNSDGQLSDAPKSMELDSCVIHSIKDVLSSQEYILWPVNEVRYRNLVGLNNTYGLVIEGKASIEKYENLLTQIIYVRKDKTSKKSRLLGLACSYGDSKRVTPEFNVKLTPVLPKYLPSNPKLKVLPLDNYQNKHGHAAANDHPRFPDNSDNHFISQDSEHKPANSLTIVIVAMSLGAACIIIIFSVAFVKIRRVMANNRRSRECSKFMNGVNLNGNGPNNVHFPKINGITNPLDFEQEDIVFADADDEDLHSPSLPDELSESDDADSMQMDQESEEDVPTSDDEDQQLRPHWDLIRLPPNTHPPTSVFRKSKEVTV